MRHSRASPNRNPSRTRTAARTSRKKTINNLQAYAAWAEIFGGLAILAGGLFAIFQVSEYRKRRRYQMAADLCRGFTEPELAKAITLLSELPEGISLAELREMDSAYQNAAQIIGMTFETMGLLVHKNIASFQIVQELAGGLLLMMWRKTERWVKDTREQANNPRFGEWMQWLAERIAECEEDVVPAYLAHAKWQKHRR